MTNRFTTKREHLSKLPRIRIIYIVCPILLAVFLLSLSSIQESTLTKQQESLETALARDITHCYAVEGFYPPSLSYMEEHYGLQIDHDRYEIFYEIFADNLMPSITVIIVGE